MADTSRRIRFEKIAGKRVANILKSLDSLEKCSNKNNYDYNPTDIKKMERVLREKVSDVIKSFSKELDKGKDNEFKF